MEGKVNGEMNTTLEESIDGSQSMGSPAAKSTGHSICSTDATGCSDNHLTSYESPLEAESSQDTNSNSSQNMPGPEFTKFSRLESCSTVAAGSLSQADSNSSQNMPGTYSPMYSRPESCNSVTNESPLEADSNQDTNSNSSLNVRGSRNHSNLIIEQDCSISSQSFSDHGSASPDSTLHVPIQSQLNWDSQNGEVILRDNDNVEQDNDQNSDDGSNTDEESSEDDSDIAGDSTSNNQDSGDETSQDCKVRNGTTAAVIDNDTESQNGTDSREVPSDNEVMDATNDEKSNSSTCDNKNVSIRHSSRAIKRRRYDLMNMGRSAEEGEALHQYHSKKNTIVVSNTRNLVEMATKHSRSQGINEKSEPTVVIIDTTSMSSKANQERNRNTVPTSSSGSLPQNIFLGVMDKGTAADALNSKQVAQSKNASQPLILPSLTDDMYVVEAPSFIVPYVYEKPSVQPFKEFVSSLGKELDDERAKVEKRNSEKQKRIKIKKSIGESIEEAEMDSVIAHELDGKEKSINTDLNNEDDDITWDGESSVDSDDEVISDEEKKTRALKDKDGHAGNAKDPIATTSSTIPTYPEKYENNFSGPLGNFFIDIGMNLVSELVQKDLLKLQNRKLYKEKKSGANTKGTEIAIKSLIKNLDISQGHNAPFKNQMKKCKFCSFKSESMLVIGHHMETPHMKNNVYKCNFCSFEIRSPHDILYHMESKHNVRGRLERAPAYHQCANCPFEDNGKSKLARHSIACAKKYRPEYNLSPPIDWEPPAKIPKLAKALSNIISGCQPATSYKSAITSNIGRTPVNIASLMSATANYRGRGRPPMSAMQRSLGLQAFQGSTVGRTSQRTIVIPNNVTLTLNIPSMDVSGVPKVLQQPSISITPVPRVPVQALQAKSTFVICEICDGYIKDLEQLRNHMQWIHKVKIHPKMIYNRPPLNCQKCQFRFFTDQGLERHLLGSHGLVTSSMQDAANKSRDAGRCPICGRVYQWKLLHHVANGHNMSLKPAHLSYKCTVCTATFGMYKQFENHVYSAHSMASKYGDKTKPQTSSTKTAPNSLLKPLNINREVTIIPQSNQSTKD